MITEWRSNQTHLSLQAAAVTWNNNNTSFNLGIFVLGTTVAYASAIHSGNYSLLPANIQTHLGTWYSRLKVYNNYTRRIQNWGTSTAAALGGATVALHQIMAHRESLRQDILAEIPGIIQELESAKKLAFRRRWWHLKQHPTNQDY